MHDVKLPRAAATRAQRIAVFLVGALCGVGLWQMYGVLLFP
jgi:hypothetical protein